ncbi:WD40/YVTN/BNR-like repeat-containing protein [Ascidiimonas aurantiaca]|uniref:WD40/YVTN/BNR-like repeat-containing protein n=1 Tax=Ascidiimonas aurantiaca TaxID=1685432 RepID=UPI0030EDE230
MKHLSTFFILLFIALPLCAQKLQMESVKGMKPRNIGPGGMSGRVTAIDVVHSNPDIMYVGTASGGLWKSESQGITWKPVFDEEVTASIGAVAIQQSNPSVIWVGTGEGNPRNSLNGGYGIYKSLDGGKNWKLMGLEKTRHIHRVIIDPHNPNTVYVGAIGSPWGEHPERGVFKTTDGGETWEKILFVNNKTGVADLVMDPTNPNKLIAAMWEHKRDPWFFNSGGPGSGLYITHDGGKTWEKRTEKEGLPKGDLGRIGIAISRSKPNIVYALIEAKKNALYKSEDGGFKWEKINDKRDIGNRPFYYSEIYVDPQNENRVYSIFTYVNVSQDGGLNFKELMPAYGVANGVHPDHHAWWIHPEDGSFMIDGNDGGLNITYDGGKSWRFIGNLPVAQFYHINVDNEFPYNVYGGMQDNGSWKGPAYVWKDQGIRNSYWQEIAFGDGFDVVPDQDNARYGYAMSQQGFVSRYDAETGNNYTVRPTHPDPDVKLRFNWNSGIGQDPFDKNTVYFGSQFVHKSTDKGLTWSIISPDLSTNDPEKQKQSESGGLTMDATGAENHCTILVIEPSPLEKDMLWVGTDDGNVQVTRDGGTTWTNVTSKLKGLPKGSWIAQIKASNKNKGEALLIANDYRRFNYIPYAYRTKDYGKTWERIVDENDAKSYTLSIVEDPVNPNLLFLGTDDGLYVSIDAGENWTKWTEGYPTVSTKDLVIQPREHDLVIGTFGRAAWVLDDIRPLRDIASDPSLLNKEVVLFEPPTAYQAAYQQPSGTRFGADAEYNAENRKRGAMITFYLNKRKEEPAAKKDSKDKKEPKEETEPDEEPKKDKVTQDSIKLEIYDGNRLIRTLKMKTPKENGIHRMYWGMREKGPNRPARKISKTKRETGGVPVKPGTYRLKLIFGETTQETTIEVASDPRLKLNPGDINEIYTAGKKLEGYLKTATDAVEQLVQSKEVADAMEKDLKKADKELHKEHIKASKEISKKADSIIDLYLGKIDKRQGITRSNDPTVVGRIQTAGFYVGTRTTGLTKTEQKLMEHARNALESALEKTNAFFNKDWKEYRAEMEKLEISPFKETKTFSID